MSPEEGEKDRQEAQDNTPAEKPVKKAKEAKE